MKLSTRGRYGIRAMYELAASGEGGPQSIKAIAERGQIPEAYLEQLIASLKKAGLVTSTRGAQGGYALSRPAAGISVGEVLRALEGGLHLVDCVQEEQACGRSCDCPSRGLWVRIQAGLDEIVDGITLQDMVDDYRANAGGMDP